MLTYTDKEWVITNGQRPCQFLNSTYIVITLLIILPVPSSAIFWSISVFIIIVVIIILIVVITIIIIIIMIVVITIIIIIIHVVHVYSPKYFFFISFTYIFSLFCNVFYQILMSTNKTQLYTILCRSNIFEI